MLSSHPSGILMKILPASLLLVALCVATTPVLAQQNEGANYETRLSALEDMARAMNGQLEQVNYAVHRLDQSVQRIQADYDARLSKLEALTSAQPPISPAGQQAADTSAPPTTSGTLGALRTQDGKITGGIKNPQAPPLPDTPADYGLTPQEQYDRAFALLRQANYEDSEKAFKSFIDKNPKDKMVDNAKYWYAETMYVRNRYADAAIAFADAFQQNPQGSKAPDCLLKLAMSLAATEKTQDACVALGELRGKYPDAAANIRSRAAEEQAKLKCNAH